MIAGGVHADADGVSRVDRLLGAATVARARRLGDRRRHRDPEARGVGVSHNPESNMKLASGVAPVPKYLRRRRRARPRHRRRREQQRPRHVRGDAAGGVPAQARDARSDRRAAPRRRWRWRRIGGARASAWSADRVARAGQARRPDHRRRHAGRGRRRCTIRSPSWSTPRTATTCGRRSSTVGC